MAVLINCPSFSYHKKLRQLIKHKIIYLNHKKDGRKNSFPK